MSTSETPRPAVEAASWALAAEVGRRAGPEYTIVEAHPGGGTYDVLAVVPRSDPTRPDAPGPTIWLNRSGSIHLVNANRATRLHDPEVWTDLVQGRRGVEDLAVALAGLLPSPSPTQRDRPEVLAWRVLASVAGLAALHQLPWTVRHAALDSSGPLDADVRRGWLQSFASHGLGDDPAVMSPETARRYWILLGYRDGQEPELIACVDTAGRLLRPGSPPGTAWDLTGLGNDLSLSHALATELIEPAVREAVKNRPAHLPQRPGLGLAATLSAFNRKERFFVMTQAAGLLTHPELHEPSLRLSASFRADLGAVLALQVPEYAFAAVDYHLSWLHGALSWLHGTAWPGQSAEFPSARADLDWGVAEVIVPLSVDGSQEDVDLLVAWTDEERSHVVAVEAKAYGAWGNQQFNSKVDRLEVLRQQFPALDVRLVLMSRNRPQKLQPSARLKGQWPEWVLAADQTASTDDAKPSTAGRLAWVPLSAPGLRVLTERCDDAGQPRAGGSQWRLAGPTGR